MLLQTFCRKFQWHELMLWPEDMPPHALVCLSHNDDLVPSAMVAKHIAGELLSTIVITRMHVMSQSEVCSDLPYTEEVIA